MRYGKEGVRLDRPLPGTVLTVQEALDLIAFEVNLEPGARTVAEFVSTINAEHERRENERIAWEEEPVEVRGVKLEPGQWYAIAERYGYGRDQKERTFRFCRYLGRVNRFGEENYRFEKWPQSAAKKVVRIRVSQDSWLGRMIVRIEKVEPTEALLANVNRDKQPVTTGSEA